MSDEEDIEDIRADLRAQLIPAVSGREMIEWVVDYVTNLPKRLSKEQFARTFAAHLSNRPIFLHHKKFVERLIENRPLELRDVISRSNFDDMGKLLKALRESGWRSAPNRRRPSSGAERAARIQASKRRHDRRRSANYDARSGLIEQHFGEGYANSWKDPSFPPRKILGSGLDSYTCLDDLFRGAEVAMSRGANSLTALFGVGRKSLPASLPFRRDGRTCRYGYRALLRCMSARLHRGRWLRDRLIRQTVLTNVIQHARHLAPEQIFIAVDEELAPFTAG